MEMKVKVEVVVKDEVTVKKVVEGVVEGVVEVDEEDSRWRWRVADMKVK